VNDSRTLAGVSLDLPGAWLRTLALASALVCLTLPIRAQEADFGLSVPVTASFGVLDSQRLQLATPSASQVAPGLRFMLYPTLKLGSHWFAYAAVQVRMRPYFYYDAFSSERQWDTDVTQAFLGYAFHPGKASVVFKAGQLSTAFGSFPLRYDDADNPVLDQPLSYITEIPLRADQLVCGTTDLLHQRYGFVGGSCGGTAGFGPGLTPVTLYGLPGVEADASLSHFDARVQLTSGSPANPQGWGVFRPYAQWAAGGGYTIRQGFRVGLSTFTGPYLNSGVASVLPVHTTVRNFPASGAGVDAQWARGRFSTNAEWQRLQFDLPGFVVQPSLTSGYGEAKAVVTPRYFVAGRIGYLKTGSVSDTVGVSASEYAPTLKSYELGGGVWLSRSQLLKASYSWLQIAGQPGTRYNVFGFEFVMRITPPSLALR
jgi:hypothetical protein